LVVQDVYQTMGRTNTAAPTTLDAAVAAAGGVADTRAWGFPAATLKATQAMVLLLARELRVQDALDVVARIRTRGMPAADEVPFGLVVSSPLAPDKPLTVRRSSCSRPALSRSCIRAAWRTGPLAPLPCVPKTVHAWRGRPN
jgi:hypothetical protein